MKNHIFIQLFIIICNERNMVCCGIEEGFVFQMTLIKEREAFLKQFGSIGPTSGSKG